MISAAMEGSEACVREGWRQRCCVGPLKRYVIVGVILVQAIVTIHSKTL